MASARLGRTARLLAAGLVATALALPAAAQDNAFRSGNDFFLAGKSRLGGPPAPPIPRSARTNRQKAAHTPPRSERSGQEHLRSAAGDRIFFRQGSAEIGTRAAAALAAQAAWLIANPRTRVLIEGHADEPLSAEEARALGQQRAHAVQRRLVAEGVAPERIAVTSYGAERHVAVCPEPECAAQNRRALTRVLTVPPEKRRAPRPAAVSR